MTVTGIRVRPDACSAMNMIWALDATSLFGFNSCKLSIAFKPKGVAALSRLSRLALKFIIICPVAGWPLGISGNILEKNGQIILDKSRTPPAFSAILKKPMNRARIPMSGIIMSTTAFLAVSIMPSTFRTNCFCTAT